LSARTEATLPTSIAHARIAIRLSPYDPLIHLPYVGLAYAHFFRPEWAGCGRRCAQGFGGESTVQRPRVPAGGGPYPLGRIDEAQSVSARLLELQPGFTVSRMLAGYAERTELMASLGEALRELDCQSEVGGRLRIWQVLC